jgi:Eukaryotic membrane protein family
MADADEFLPQLSSAHSTVPLCAIRHTSMSGAMPHASDGNDDVDQQPIRAFEFANEENDADRELAVPTDAGESKFETSAHLAPSLRESIFDDGEDTVAFHRWHTAPVHSRHLAQSSTDDDADPIEQARCRPRGPLAESEEHLSSRSSDTTPADRLMSDSLQQQELVGSAFSNVPSLSSATLNESGAGSCVMNDVVSASAAVVGNLICDSFSSPGPTARREVGSSPDDQLASSASTRCIMSELMDAETASRSSTSSLADGNGIKPVVRASRASLPPPAFQTFAHYLMGMDPVQSSSLGSTEDDINDAWSIAPKRQGVYNLIQVPMRLEKLLFFSCCICADEFLFLFTLLPIRCAVAVISMAHHSFLSLVQYWRLPLSRFGHRSSAFHATGHAHRVPQHAVNCRVSTVIDLMHLSVFVFTSMVLASFDISYIYHNIRGQSVIKLYVVFNVMEIFDRLCCSFGVDILDSLGWTTASAVNYFNARTSQRVAAQQRAPRNSSGPENAVSAQSFRGFVLLTRVTVDYLCTLVYVCLHATVLVLWVVTLNVAINTQNNALLTLLVSNNFVELKGSVFKNYKVQNLFQIACSDAVERFQLTIFLAVMLVYADGDRRLLLTWSIIFLCEVIVDWIKHAFVTKFNRIPHRAYQQFTMVICGDIVQARKNSAVRSIGGSGVAKRVGFVSLPLGALVVRMTSAGIWRLPALGPVLIFLVMFTVKITLSVGLLGFAIRRMKPDAERGERETAAAGGAVDDEAWLKSLANVGRYDKS